LVWLFDYDLTLYGHDEQEVLARLDRNITRFIRNRLGMSEAEADALRRSYWGKFGTTLAGLRAQYGVTSSEYFDFIHTGDLILPRQNLALRELLLSLPGQRWVFSNARCDWVTQGLRSMGVADCFHGIMDIEGFGWRCKPCADIYPLAEQRIRATGSDVVFVDDRADNLEPGRALGWRTVLIQAAAAPTPEGQHLVLPRLLDLRHRADPAWFV
jgi:putative hydrolase of the HAD superfamily